MLWVHTLFDYSKSPPRPLITGIGKDGKVSILPLYLHGTGSTLLAVKKRLYAVAKLMMEGDTSVNDYKAHLQAFPITPNKKTLCRPGHNYVDGTLTQETAAAILNDDLSKAMASRPSIWQWTLAEAHSVYNVLEKRGITDGVEVQHPIYSTDTFSGRSKTTGFNIQGTNAESIVLHVNPYYDYFVNFDWIAADVRVGSILSNDKVMLDSFIKSDPYEAMAKDLGLSRDDCKQPFLSTVYSLDVENHILDYYPTFKQWMKTCVAKIRSDGALESILGRKFSLGEVDRTEKSVFNAVIQGSVAHAMQRAITRLNETFPEFIVTEVHDSLIMACDRASVKTVMEEGIKIMTRPLNGVADVSHTFPTRISVGREWRKWQLVKEAR
jgi:hypothetical protein